MRRQLKCGCDVLANRIYLCENHTYIAEELVYQDNKAEAKMTSLPKTQPLLITEGAIIDAVIIESRIKDET